MNLILMIGFDTYQEVCKLNVKVIIVIHYLTSTAKIHLRYIDNESETLPLGNTFRLRRLLGLT